MEHEEVVGLLNMSMENAMKSGRPAFTVWMHVDGIMLALTIWFN